MTFPNPPFTLGENADKHLVEYLRNFDNFTYLEKPARKKIQTLKQDLRQEYKILKELWPLVLTDALKRLKRHDCREWDKKNKNIRFDSFFHEHSLGVTELEKVFTGFTEFEGMLYGASPDRYRDHIAHAFRVWIIGHGILNNCFEWDLAIDKGFEKKISEEEWQCMWAIAALCHDVGYPLTAIEKINQQARNTLRSLGLTPAGDLRFVFSQQMLPFHDTIIKLMSSKLVESAGEKPSESKYLTHLQNKYYLKLLKSFDKPDHGIASSLLISKALVYFLESDLSHDNRSPLSEEDARQFLIRREILRAIAAHTCQDIYHLKFDTLSFLLYIVDELQCWGRPTLEELQHQSGGLRDAEAKIKKFSRTHIDIQIKTHDDIWDRDQKDGLNNQLDKLHRMLRLAVDTPTLSKELFFRLSIINNMGKEGEFFLTNGKITKKAVK